MFGAALKQLDTQRRIIGAVMIREIYLRFGREGIGFLWLFAEPLMFGIPVFFMWSIVRPKYEHGVLMMGMVITGYLPILLFRHVGGVMLVLVRSSVDLLYHRQITLFDVFVARGLLEFISNIMALVIAFLLFYILGDVSFPVDFAMFLIGYLFMFWWAMAIGLLVGATAERSVLVEKTWPVYSYTYMFFSGFFFLADWLPPKLREVALWQPSLQAYEMIRAGMFGKTLKTYGSPSYTALVLAVMTFVGLLALREARRHVEVE